MADVHSGRDPHAAGHGTAEQGAVDPRVADPRATGQEGAGQEAAGHGDVPGLVRSVTARDPSRSFWLGLALGMLLVIATLLFIVQNGQSTQLHWLMLDFRAPLWLFLLAAAVSGAVLERLGTFLWRRARTRAAKRRAADQRLAEIARGGTG